MQAAGGNSPALVAYNRSAAMAATDEELVSMYADLIKYTKREIEEANVRLSEYASKLANASHRVANK